VPWDVVYFKATDDSIPAEEFLEGCPAKVEAKFQAILDAVAAAPPPAFSGGGMWEAMHGEMTGYYEVRVGGPSREQFRLFCLLERKRKGLPGPAIVVLTGMRKKFMTTFSGADYAEVRRLGEEFKASSPPAIAT
jgi:hypothetical protein